MKKVIMMVLTMAMTVAAGAQTSGEPKLEVKPSGRILFDAAYLKPQHQEDELKSGVEKARKEFRKKTGKKD